MQQIADPITLEVLRNAMQSIAEEMGAILTRTAFSPNIKDRRDFSTAIYTPDGRLVAQAEHIPLHLGLMPFVVQTVLKEYSINEMSSLDAIIINDPYISGSHLPDICIVCPVFHQESPLAVVANLAHHVDIGGCVPGSMSTTSSEIFQEGLRIPPVKIRNKYGLNKELLKILSANVRTNREFYGDIQAQLTANDVGSRRLQDLARRYGVGKLKFNMEEIINYTGRRLHEALKIIPAGSYSFEDYLEGDGLDNKLINIYVCVSRDQKGMKFDFSGTHPQVRGPVNATRAVTLACVYFAVKAVVDPSLPSSDGLTQIIEVITPQGTLVNPSFPAPVAHANINTAQRITDVLLGALSRATPELVTAAGTGSMSNFTIGGIHPGNKEYYSYIETYGGGQGAKHDQDGMDGVHVNMTNTRNTPVEIIELNYPLRVEQYCLAPGTGGPGKFRGGLGLKRELTVLGHTPTVAISTERTKLEPWGMKGGLPGKGALAGIKTGENNHTQPDIKANSRKMPLKELTEVLSQSKFTSLLSPGTRVFIQTAGGGGYGNPLERNPELVRKDALEEFISLTEAKEQYGVILIGDNMLVDVEATLKERKKLP